MTVKNKALPHLKSNLPNASSAALRGKQSVRAAFKLTENCIHAINIVATHLGIKQKSLFDHLIEDTEALKTIAQGNRAHQQDSQSLISKTFVISRKSLEMLNKISIEFGVPKEALVEQSVKRLLPIIAKEQATHEDRKKVIKQINDHLNQGKKIHKKIKKQFGSNDIIYQKFDQIIKNYTHCIDEIEKYINKSKNIENFELDSF